jgi:hypothetical protein
MTSEHVSEAQPDVVDVCSRFAATAVDLYKNLICRGETRVSGQLFRRACASMERVAAARQSADAGRREAYLRGAVRGVQRCLLMVLYLDIQGYLCRSSERHRVYATVWSTLNLLHRLHGAHAEMELSTDATRRDGGSCSGANGALPATLAPGE